jgi:anti-sigma-K factor RskA
MANQHTPEERQAFLEDVAAFAAGELSEERAAALMAAARVDATVMQALRGEEALDKLLELYEFPEMPVGIEKRFWERFQQEKIEGESIASGRTWWLKIATPIAAAILLALGLIYLPPTTETPDPGKVSGNPPGVEKNVETAEEEDYVLPFVAAEENSEKPRELKAEELKLLKAMDDARLQPLGDLQDPEDARLVDILDTLETLEPQRDQ